MAVIRGRPKPIAGLPAPSKLDEERLVFTGVLNKGMVSSIDPADIDESALSVARNARIRFDKTSRRAGKSLYTPVKPNSLTVRKIIEYKPNFYTLYIVRVTDTGVHFSDDDSWTVLTGTLTGGSQNIVTAAVVQGVLIIANGSNRLQKVDIDAETISDLGAIAPRAKFVTGFADRVVAATDTTVYWSGNRNLSEFDAAEDISAGNNPLVISPSDRTDPISGIFGLTTVMIIPRERSIWLATRQPIAADPFHFYSAVPGVGFDLPGSIAVTKDGIIGASMYKGNIYKYSPGGAPAPIGDPVVDQILDNIDDPNLIFSDFDYFNLEYILGIPQSGSDVTKLWIFNERTGAWSYDEQEDVTTASVITLLSAYTSIDELVGDIDSLVGTIDSLSVAPTVIPTVLVGTDDGEIMKEDAIVDQDDEVDFEFEARSKEFVLPKLDILVNEIRIEYEATIQGSITLQYTKDNGTTWTTAKTITTTVGGRRLIQFKKLIKSRRIMWRITATNGAFDVLSYEINTYGSGESGAGT